MEKEDILEHHLLKAYNIFRKKIKYHNCINYFIYILSILLLRYIYDNYDLKKNIFKLTIDREEFNLLKFLNKNIDKKISSLLVLIKTSKEKINYFNEIDFSSEQLLGNKEERYEALEKLIKIIYDNKFYYSNSQIGDAYKTLVKIFYSSNEKKIDDLLTPLEISELILKLSKPQKDEKLFDPTCGSGSLLIKVAKNSDIDFSKVYAEEIDTTIYNLFKINIILNNMEEINSKKGDSLSEIINEEYKFDIIISNPPFMIENTNKNIRLENFKDIQKSIKLIPKADYLFILNVLKLLKDTNNSRGLVIAPYSILSRENYDKEIREHIVNLNYIDTIISLPKNLFINAQISTVVIILKKNKKNDNILFIDASDDNNAYRSNYKNILKNETISIIEDLYSKHINNRLSYKKGNTDNVYYYNANLDEVKNKDYNLNVSLYINNLINSNDKNDQDIKNIKYNIENLQEEINQLNLRRNELINSLINYQV